MNILILAAGLGTRLRPLTDTMPKALVPVGGKPLLQILIEKIKRQCDDPHVVINIHHHGQQIIDFVEANHSFDIPIAISDERDQLLDTGGAIKKAMPLFRQSAPVLIHNVDILSDINLPDVYHAHLSGADRLATLVVSRRNTSRYLLFGSDSCLAGWTNVSTGEVRSPYNDLEPEKYDRYAFSGIHVVAPQIAELMSGWPERFSIIDFYLSVCHRTKVAAHVMEGMQLVDVGRLDTLAQAENAITTMHIA